MPKALAAACREGNVKVFCSSFSLTALTLVDCLAPHLGGIVLMLVCLKILSLNCKFQSSNFITVADIYCETLLYIA